METETIIIVSLFSVAWALLCAAVLVLTCQVSRLQRQMAELLANPRLKAQKVTLDTDNHAFRNPVISPDEELSRRGYSMYVAEDVESGRGTTERQTGGQFVEELTRELERHQQQRKSPPPPFLLSAIEDNRRNRPLNNPIANPSNNNGNPNKGKTGESNPNFIY